MFGRRSHERFVTASSTEGILRVLRDVLVQTVDDSRVIAISRDAGVVGEELTLEIPEENIALQMQVMESRPVIVDGAVRHRLGLKKLKSFASS